MSIKAITLSYLTTVSSVNAVNFTLNGVGTESINANTPFTDGFVSYSIEFASFPDFAGNKSAPNVFSDNLLTNIGNLIGTKPHIRVGGNTQDYALYNASLPYALNGTFNYNRSYDYPTTIHIGPSYFESYSTWSNVKFTHGFNMGLGGNNSAGWQTLLDTVPLACKAISPENLNYWEYGNEPDLFSTSSQGPVRPPSWNETTYVKQWLNGTDQIKALLQEHCPEHLSNGSYGYFAPSFAGTSNHLKAPAAWQAGLNKNGDVKLFSTHNYISGASSPGVTLQGTLLNHTSTVASVDKHVTEYNTIFPNGSGVPFIMGETNSLYNEGKPGLSNSFGAALWGVDFNLYCASVGIRRVHMHMGTDYRYASWQPIQTKNTTIGTKAPYYGNIAVAAFLGDTTKQPVAVAHVALAETWESAYATYENGALARVLILNMNTFNTTVNGTGLGLAPNPPARITRTYTFGVDNAAPEGAKVLVKRLYANGSDAITGITWDGWSYNYELDHGRPVRLDNVTTGEYSTVGSGGLISVNVPDASAVMLDFKTPVVLPGNGTSNGRRRYNILGWRG